MDIHLIIKKYKDIIPYLFFGVCTTIVNVIVYWISAHLLRFGVTLSTFIAWFLSVLFAYFTNRKWVFKSKVKNKNSIIKEILSFFSCRVGTGVLDWLIMLYFVESLNLNDLIIKIISNFVVIVLNYFASKFLIFKKDGE